MLKLKHIVKDYVTKQQTVHVLKDLTITFRESEFVTILGQSGCGKTTLLNIVGGLDRYTSGDIIINGKSTKDFDDRDWDRYRNKQIGFVFQSYNLIPHLSVLQNVELALTLAGKHKEERAARALDALKKVGLEDQAYKKPSQMSGGQMQRVAIARALVNNPDIIMADEPTGALDSESGTMVMELLKEVAKDRLVIMVSHNAELANQYSTRTVVLKDGVITSDSNPFVDENDVDDDIIEDEVADSANNKKKSVRQRIKKTYAQIQKEKKEERKVSMSEGTALELSARNLLSKKWRTFLTSFAGSIGIIGIALVLALSSGVNSYIAMTEESALSIYPLTIGNTNFSLTEMAGLLMAKSEGEKFPKHQQVLINKVAGNLFSGGKLKNVVSENDMPSIKRYLDDKMDDEDGYFTSVYDSEINIYRKIPKVNPEDTPDPDYTKINPFQDSIDGFVAGLGISGINDIIDQYREYLTYFSVFTELINNQKLLDKQYDLIGEQSRWPCEQGYTLDENGHKVFECVIQVDPYNKISDYMLFAAGLMHPDEFPKMLDLTGNPNDSKIFFDRYYTLEELLNVEYKILADSDYFVQVGENSFKMEERTKDTSDFIENASEISMKIVGIVRPKENASASSISGVIGYPHSLIEAVIERCQGSAVVEAQLNNWWGTAKNGEKIHIDDILSIDESVVDIDKEISNESIIIGKSFKTVLDIDNPSKGEKEVKKYAQEKMGYAEIEKPKSINIYASSFKGKENIINLLDNYQNSEYNPKRADGEGGIKYTDMFATMMNYVKQMASAMVSALIAFSAISLIVSSIMIAIITYTSVLERRKEIGVLRSIGARKLDISNLFISESSIIGFISGIIGIVFGYIFVAIANAVILSVLDIPNLLHLDWYFAVVLVIVSFLLSLVAGIIPASIAANKDPVECLRTE